jgi:hypothetical protein
MVPIILIFAFCSADSDKLAPLILRIHIAFFQLFTARGIASFRASFREFITEWPQPQELERRRPPRQRLPSADLLGRRVPCMNGFRMQLQAKCGYNFKDRVETRTPFPR